MDLDLTVLALSQLGRALEARKISAHSYRTCVNRANLNRQPTRFSACTALGVRPTTIEVGIMEILILKQRSGRAGVTVKAAWSGERTAVFPLAHGYGDATVTRGPAASSTVQSSEARRKKTKKTSVRTHVSTH